VTVDVKKTEDIMKEYSLKFWLLNNNKKEEKEGDLKTVAATEDKDSFSYELIAQMNNPHGDYSITDLSLVTDGKMNDASLMGLVATASVDGTVKVWRGVYETFRNIIKARDNSERNQDLKTTKFLWKCFYSFQYRETPIYSLVWSMDASVLCVAYDNMITFWNPQT
jgi:WD40 repeat protein